MIKVFCDYCNREIEIEKEIVGVCSDCEKVICMDCIKEHEEKGKS